MASALRRVAVTGASGRCAAGLLDRLERDPSVELILAIDIRPLPRRRGPKVAFHSRDVADSMGTLLVEHAIDTVVHLAFAMSPGHDRAASRRVNVGGMESVLNAVAESGVGHLVYLSSTTVYGAHADNPPLLTEESPLRPPSGFQYGEDKVTAERMLGEFLSRHAAVTACILRACPVVGPGCAGPMTSALAKPVVVSIRGSDPPMQLLHQDDLADVMALCAQRRVSGVYNVAGEGGVAWGDIVRSSGRRSVALPESILRAATGAAWRLRLQSDSPAAGLDFIKSPWIAGTEKLRRDLGLELRYSSKEAWAACRGGDGLGR